MPCLNQATTIVPPSALIFREPSILALYTFQPNDQASSPPALPRLLLYFQNVAVFLFVISRWDRAFAYAIINLGANENLAHERRHPPIVFLFKNRPPPNDSNINKSPRQQRRRKVVRHRHRELFIRPAPTQYSILNNSPPVYYKYTRPHGLLYILQTVAADCESLCGGGRTKQRRPTPRIHLFIFLLLPLLLAPNAPSSSTIT